MPETEQDFLPFAYHLYEQAGVADTCLWLQDHHQLDVMITLFCLWAGHRHGALSPQTLGQLCSATDVWRSSVVQPLRAARRWLKEQPHSGRDAQKIETLRNTIKDSELLAEQLQGEWLEQALANSRHPVTVNPGTSAARANLQGYITLAGAVDLLVMQRAESLLDAAANGFGV